MICIRMAWPRKNFQLCYCSLTLGVLFSLIASHKSLAQVVENTTKTTAITNITSSTPASNGTTPTKHLGTPTIVASPATRIPTFGYFNLTQNGSICLIANMKCEVTNQITAIQSKESVLPANAVASGQCAVKDASQSFILLQWNDHSLNFSLKLQFSKKSKHSIWRVSDIAVNIVSRNISYTASTNQSNKFRAPLGSYYQCLRSEKVPLNSGITVDFRQVELQPFPGKEGSLGTVMKCASRDHSDFPPSSNIVPIVVGCVLGGLIATLLVTYCVGCGKTKEYEQM